MQGTLPVSCRIIKKYFCFILLSMNFYYIMVKGKSLTDDGGLDLLNKTHKEKQRTCAPYEDPTITIE
jgi:hypothetical protein